MTYRAITAIVAFSIACAIAGADIMFLSYGGWHVAGRDQAGAGWMGFLNFLGAGALGLSIICFLHYLFTTGVFGYIGRVLLGVWVVAVTVALVYILYVLHSVK